MRYLNTGLRLIQLRIDKLRKVSFVKECSKCEILKAKYDFEDGHKQCKDCLNEYRIKWKVESIDRYISKCITEGLLKEVDRFAAKLLLISCESRYYACRNDNRGTYNNIECPYPTFKDFFHDCLKKKGFFNRWKELSNVYEDTNNSRDRPQIDRINSELHYTMDNIRPMTKYLNATLAKAEPLIFVLHEVNNLRKVAKDMFNSVTSLIKHIEHHYPTVNANKLVEKAINTAKDKQGELCTFEYKDKSYYIQMMYMNKQGQWYMNQVETTLLQHINQHYLHMVQK